MRITGLWIYPVKSLGGMAVPRAAVTARGSFGGDREWLVVDGEGRMLWQGDLPRMALLRATLARGRLGLVRPDREAMAVDADHGGEACVVTQYRHAFAGVDAGDAAAAFLSDWLGRRVRLVRIGAAAHDWPAVKPLHVLSDRSLAALDERLALVGEGPMAMERFRPNVLVAASAAWQEEAIPVIDFGQAALQLLTPATRCELPNIDPLNASRGREPLRTIARMSRERDTALRGSFGVYSWAWGPHLSLGMTTARAEAPVADHPSGGRARAPAGRRLPA